MLYDILQLILSIGRAGKKIVRGKDNIGQGPGVFGNGLHVDCSCNVAPAVTDKDADTRVLVFHVPFRAIGFFLDHRIPGVCQETGRRPGRAARLNNRIRDILGTLKRATDKEAVP